MKQVPFYLMEEHNEAYFIWQLAVLNREMRPFGNTLLHIDHHPDFEAGAYNKIWTQADATLADAAVLTRRVLGIADFICPAIWRGIFNDIVFIEKYNGFLSKPVRSTLMLTGEKELTLGEKTPYLRIQLLEDSDNIRLFTYSQGGLGCYSGQQPCVLDIDIDYFCNDNSLSTAAPKKLEITPQAYAQYEEDPYHPFRILPRMLVTAHRENDGRCFLVYQEHTPTPAPPSEQTVLKRIKLFLRWLKTYEVCPQIITICRSRHSGYTPSGWWEFIERNLLEGMEQLYDLQSREGWIAHLPP